MLNLYVHNSFKFQMIEDVHGIISYTEFDKFVESFQHCSKIRCMFFVCQIVMIESKPVVY